MLIKQWIKSDIIFLRIRFALNPLLSMQSPNPLVQLMPPSLFNSHPYIELTSFQNLDKLKNRILVHLYSYEEWDIGLFEII